MRTYKNKAKDGFEEIIIIKLPFDCKKDKNNSKNYGVHGLNIWYMLKKNNKAVQFLLYASVFDLISPLQAWDLGYHSPTPMYPDQQKMDDCNILDDNKCYYDGSGLTAQLFFEKIWQESINDIDYNLEDKIFEKLREEYFNRFEDKD